jgi:hypothetical protein
MGGTNEVSEQLRKGPRSYELKNNTRQRSARGLVTHGSQHTGHERAFTVIIIKGSLP